MWVGGVVMASEVVFMHHFFKEPLGEGISPASAKATAGKRGCFITLIESVGSR